MTALNSISTLPQGWWLYVALALLALLEGPVAILLGGAAISASLMKPGPAYIAVCLGNLSADMGWYVVGRASKHEWIVWLSRKGRIDAGRLKELEESVQKYAPRLLFLAKLTVALPIPTLIATGLTRTPVRRWAFWLILGEMTKSAVLMIVGYLYAQAIGKASAGVQMVLWGFTAAVIIVGAIVWKQSTASRDFVAASDSQFSNSDRPDDKTG